MLGRKERGQLELFITGSLRQLIPDDHILARVDRFSICPGFVMRSAIFTAPTMGVPASIPKLRSG